MLITVDEARQLKKDYFFWLGISEKERDRFNTVVNLFTIWFFILTLARSLVVATIIAALIEQEPDIAAAWESGKGVAYFLIYLVVCCLPVIGNLANFLVPIGVIIACFATGKGIGYNFPTFVLPMIFAYIVTFGLIFLSNSALNSLLQKMCPEVYRKLGGVSNVSNFYNEGEIVEEENNNNIEENDELDDDGYYDDGL